MTLFQSRSRIASFFIAVVILLVILQFSLVPFSAGVMPKAKLHLAELLPVATLPPQLGPTVVPSNSSLPAADYDEQLGFTFTQNFTGLSYNVTAIEQQDVYGYGPAYLLNGLTNLGYWYQVGLSWDWPIANGGFSPGFAFNYEVFSPNGTSIFPPGAGGIANFTGPVNPGDEVGLSLTFNGESVTMEAIDWKTNSLASVAYESFGASEFVGLPLSISNGRGYFTGLMTEQYHVAPYNGSETKVTFSSDGNVSSAWMWVDEFNANTSSLIFQKSTAGPISYLGSLSKFQYFFSEGATLLSNAFEFVTGTSGSVLLTVSYSPVGGTPPVPPKFVYSSNGSIISVQLGGHPTTYLVDNGSTWSVSGTVPGLNSTGERWTTPNTTSGIAGTDQTIKIVYFHQYLESLSFQVVGGGTDSGTPELTFESNGRPNSLLLGNAPLKLWVDANTGWNSTNPLPGSTSSDRWLANSTSGFFSTEQNLTISYFHESLVSVGYSIVGGGGGFSPPQLDTTSLNSTVEQILSIYPVKLWLDDGAQWNVSSYLNGPSVNERLITRESAGTVNYSEILPAYYRQELVSFTYSIKGNRSGFAPPIVNWSSFGVHLSAILNSTPAVWADYGTAYSYTNLVLDGANARWIADSMPNGTVTNQSTINVGYQAQYYVSISQPRGGGGTILAPESGWYNSSEVITLASRTDPGWKFENWVGTGEGAYSGNSSSTTLSVNSPLAETADFYPSFTIVAGKGGFVSYKYGGKTGVVKSGQNTTIYVPPLSEISLSASSSSSLDVFTNWHGSISSASESMLLQIRSPEMVKAAFGFDYPLILLSIAGVCGAIALIVVSALRRRQSRMPENWISNH